MKNPWVIIGVIAIVLFGGAFWYAGYTAEKNNDGIGEIPAHVKGNPDAEVVLVEYSDLQCPACAAFLPAVNQVVEAYGDSLRFEYKHFPLPIHPFAVDAAVAAEAAAQQGKFFEYHDVLFENQQTWSRSTNPKALFLQYAEDLELDMGMFRRHMNATLLKEHVESQFAEGRDLGITGTPTFFLNGERMQIQTYEGFITQIANAINGEDVTSTDPVTEQSDSGVRFGL